MRRLPLALTLWSLLLPAAARAQDVTAVLRGGVYADSDHTQVYRSLAAAQAESGHLSVSAQEEIDVLTSASADVRASPFLDALTGASPVSPTMSDRRFETTAAVGWNDRQGHSVSVSAVYATELDYTSAGGGVQVSWDFFDRNTTLFGGANGTSNDVGSVVDHSFSKSLGMAGYSLGVAQLLSPRDVLRLRYDGAYLDGYQASPYRAVRFGNWHTALRPGGTGLLFLDTIGSPSGLPEQLPGTRLRHAGTLDWVHSLRADLALALEYRLGYDDWGVLAHTGQLELRVHHLGQWQLRGGYRFYYQGAADFWQPKYTAAPETYRYYTADKELGEVRGHSGDVDVGYAFWRRPGGQLGALVDFKAEYLYYSYPGFPLLANRSSVFGETGIRLEF
jgi:hypothetical protein